MRFDLSIRYLYSLAACSKRTDAAVIRGIAKQMAMLEQLYDATNKYMQHKNDTASEIGTAKMDVRMSYSADVLGALEALK